MTRSSLLGLAVLLAIGLWGWWRHASLVPVLPPTLTLEDTIADLLADFTPEAVVAQRADAPVGVSIVTPGEWIRGDGPRPALTMAAPARVRLRATVPAGGAIQFAVGVGGVTQREDDRSGVRFSVAVDGMGRWSRTVDPAATRRDRRWFAEQLRVGTNVERTIELELTTEPSDPRYPVAGTPGWSRLHVVRSSSRARQRADPRRPNLLVLLIDTLRADRVGGHPSLTPALDALGDTGLRFDDAIAQASWTVESVPSIMTGRLPCSHGVRGRVEDQGADDVPTAGDYLADSLDTWAEAAARVGISTFAASTNPVVSTATNFLQGFETRHEFGWDPETRDYTPAATVNSGFLAWLRANRQWRFAAYLHYMEPHAPYTPPRALRPPAPPGAPPAIRDGWVRDIARRINNAKAPLLARSSTDYLERLYDGEVRAWDAALPELIEGLRALDLLASTVIIVTSDHGEGFQEHGHLLHGRDLHDELVHVPLIVVGPGVPRGHRPDLVQGIDLFPTIARLLDVPAPGDLAGRPLLDPDPSPREVISETSLAHTADGTRVDGVALRTPDWTLLHRRSDGTFELFDRRRDRAERHVLPLAASGSTDLPGRLHTLLAAAPPPPRSSERAGDFRERLRVLGYVD